MDKYLRQRKTLKATRGKQQITYKVTPIRLSSDFTAEIQQAKRQWHDISKAKKGKDLQPRIPCLRRPYSSDAREKSKALQRTHYHQTRSATNPRKEKVTTRDK